jgi:CHAT domain-containing protein
VIPLKQRFLICVTAILLATFASTIWAAVILEEGLELPIDPDETVELPMVLSAGDLLHAMFEQQGIDLAIAVADPDGSVIWTRDNLQAGTGLEDAWVVADRDGRYVVRVTAHGEKPGRLKVAQLEHRPATSIDRLRIAGERKMAEARAAFRERTPESIEQARGAAVSAAASFAEAGLAPRQVAALYQLGLCLRDLARFDEALSVLHEGLAVADASDGQIRTSNLHHAVASVHAARGEMDAAVAEIERARDEAASAGDSTGQAWAWNNLGIYQRRLGRVDLAVSAMRAAADLFAADGNQRGSLTARLNQGLLQMERGNADGAIEAYRQVLAGARALGDREREAYALHDLGDAYGVLGDHQRALDLFTQALVIRRQIATPGPVASSLANAGLAADALGDHELAIAHLEEALKLYRLIEDRNGESFALHHLGLLRLPVDRAAGLDLLDQALAIRRDIGDRGGEGTTLLALGTAHLDAGELDAAMTPLGEALARGETMADPFLEAEAQFQRARLAAAQGETEIALNHVQRAGELAESVRRRVSSEELRATWMAAVRHYAELEVQLLLKLGRLGDAFEASEGARARVMVDLVDRSWVPVTTEPALAEEIRAAEAGIVRSQRSLMDARSESGVDPDEIGKMERQSEQAFDRYREVRESVRSRQPRRAAFLEPTPATLRETRHLLGVDTALLEFLVGDDRSVVFVVTSDAVTVHTLPGRERLTADAELMLKSIDSPGRRGRLTARLAAWQLYQTAVAVALKDVGDRDRLLVVADGPLHAVPFDALVTRDPTTTDRPAWLLDRFVITVAPSMTVLRLLGSPPQATGPSTRLAVAGFADPVVSDETAATLLSDGLELGPLPDSRRELKEVGETVGRDHALLSVGADATEERLVGSPEVAAATTLHLATHGLIDDLRPDRTALLMTPSPGHDGLLHTYEIFELELANEQVVLSACQTGLGREVRGEGMMGLAHAFFHAGARRLVVSLWSVADASTSDLMVRFYRHMVDHDPATALTLAKRELANESSTANPFHWAPFVLVGDPGHVPVARMSD